MRWFWLGVLAGGCNVQRALPLDEPVTALDLAGADLRIARDLASPEPDLQVESDDLTLPTIGDLREPPPDLATPASVDLTELVTPDLTAVDLLIVPRTPQLALVGTFGIAQLVLAGDVDGDGAADLVEIGGSQFGNDWPLVVWHGDGHGSFVGQPSTISLGAGFIRGARLVDIDGDGDLDVAAADEGSSRLILSRNSGGIFQPIETVSVPSAGGVEDVEAADLDGDGVVDFALVGQDGLLRILRGGGANLPVVVGSHRVGSEPVTVRAGDLDHDGRRDLVTANRFGNSVSSLRNFGSLSFGAPVTAAAGFSPWGLAVGDFDRDGVMDVAAQDAKLSPSTGAGMITILRGRSLGAPRTVSLVSAGGSLNWLGAADLDGDGVPDLVGGNTDHGGTTVLPSSGGNVVVLSPDRGSWSGAFADFDGDGQVDVAVATLNNGPVGIRVYLNQ